MKQFKLPFIWNTIKTLFASVLSLYMAYFVNDVISNAIDGETEKVITSVIYVLVAITLVYLLDTLIGSFVTKYTEKKKLIYRKALIEEYLLHSKSKLNTQEVMKRVGSDFEKVFESQVMLKSALLSDLIVIVIGLVLLSRVSILLAAILLLMTLLNSLLPIMFKTDFTKIYGKVEEIEEEVESEIKETVDNFKSIKSHNLEQSRIKDYDKILSHSIEETIIAEKKWHLFSAMTTGVKQTVILSFITIVIMFTVNNVLDISNVIFVILVTNIINTKVERIVKASKSLVESKVSLTRLNEIRTKIKTGDYFNEEITSLQINTLSFGYESPIFEDLSITFKKGEITQLIGENGSGKSTLINLICGELTDYSGQIMINDKELKSLELASYRAKYSLLSQSNQTFEGDVRFNLNLEQNVSTRLIQEFRLDNQLLSKKASELSEGQKQRIAIVRSLSKQANLLILDEPESFLDAYSISKLVEHLKKENNIIILISHSELFDDLVDQRYQITEKTLRRLDNDQKN